MQIIRIQTEQDWTLFHQVLAHVYQSDPHYIFPLEHEIRQVFDPAANARFSNGEAACWVLLDDQEHPIGRIAAFIDYQAVQADDRLMGGIGFFECIPDDQAAHQLFAQAEQWLKEKGAALIEAPVNFGERDRFWGLLVKGFTSPLYQENYHPAYYQSFFEEQGYIPFEQSLTFKGKTELVPAQRLAAIAQRLKERHPIRVEPLDFKQIDRFAHDFCEVYNAAFSTKEHFKPFQPGHIARFMREAQSIADPGLICIAYYDDHPAGFVALFPDINPFLRKAKGKLNWRTIPGFFLRTKLAKTKDIKGMGFGVHPDYQSKGIFSVLVEYLYSPRVLKRYPNMYLSGIRAHNKKIISMYDKLKVEVDRIHLTYRKPLAPGIEIQPTEFLAESS